MASNQVDLHSFTWAAVKHVADEAIEESHKVLEARTSTERDTDFNRGRIYAMREILDLANRDSEHVSE